jgi:hypothetical protein
MNAPTTTQPPSSTTGAMRRSREQSMGYWLNEPAILDPGRIVAAMADLAANGYGIVRVILRQTQFHHRSPEVITAVAAATAAAHRHGMRIVFDCEPHGLVAREIGRVHPEAIGQRVWRGEGPIRAGRFRVDLHLDAFEGVIFDQVVAAAVSDADGVRAVPVPVHDLVWETAMSPDGIADDRQDYVAGRPMRQRRHVRLSGTIAGAGGGTLALYVACKDLGLVDFAAPGVMQWYRELVADYRHIPLDGLCWDEPAVAGDWRTYRSGRAFAEAFAARNGYALASRMHLLDVGGHDPAAVRVRLDYYRTLNETLAVAQADLVAAARAAFGPGCLLGNHHTWQGEGGINDYRAGAVDYFRLNDAMDAGYTDCCWWDMASVAYSYALGSSLGRLTPSGEAECNTWHWKPTNRATRFHARLMSLMDITWFNIWYGDDGDTCAFPRHYAWAETAACMRRHRDWQGFLAGAKPVAEIAVLHDWHGVCGANSAHAANLHKAFCMNFALKALNESMAFDFLDERLLAAAKITDAGLETALGRYRVLVVPGASVVPRAAWTAIAAFARAGGRVVFCGPPPTLDAEGGDLTREFAALFAMPLIGADEYDAWFLATGVPMPGGRPERFDLAMPLEAEAGRLIQSTEGIPHGVRAGAGMAVWFSGYEASSEVIAQCRAWSAPAVACHAGSVLWRMYRKAGKTLVMLVAREDMELSGIIEVGGQSFRLHGGESACIVIPEAGPVEVVTQPPARAAIGTPAPSGAGRAADAVACLAY